LLVLLKKSALCYNYT